MKSKLVYYDGTKTFDLWNGDRGWTILSGEGKQTADTPAAYATVVGWMYRCCQLYSNAIASIPLDLMKGDTAIDSTDEWKNKLDFLPSPELLTWMVAASQGLTGAAYLYMSQNRNGVVKTLRYLSSDTITYRPELNKFERRVGTESKLYQPAIDPNGVRHTDPECIVPLWIPDPAQEWGPPDRYPGLAACKAAGVMYNMDVALEAFFGRGMIGVSAFSVPPGTQPQEKERFEERMQRVVMGVRNAFRTIFLEAGKVERIDLGGTLKDMGNQPLSESQREEMAAAWGVPLTKLLSTDAGGLGGGGVSDADDRRMYSDTAVPALNNILRSFNVQVLEPLGVRLVERHERMDMFQDDENARSGALVNYTNAFAQDPEVALAMCDILGIEVPDEAQAKIDEILRRKEEDRQKVEEQTSQPAAEEERAINESEDDDLPVRTELARLQKKALKHIGKQIKFESDVIPCGELNRILAALPDCTDEAAVRAVFTNVSVKTAPPVTVDVTPMVQAIEAEVKAILDTKPAPAPQPIQVTIHNHPGEPPIVNVPEAKADAPVVTVNIPTQPAPVVNISVPEQPAPIVNVTNDVQPAEVTVKLPKRKGAKVKRDTNGQVESIEEL